MDKMKVLMLNGSHRPNGNTFAALTEVGKQLEKDEHQENSQWILCPVCGSKTRVKVYESTLVLRFPLYCPRCKHETNVNISKLKITISK